MIKLVGNILICLLALYPAVMAGAAGFMGVLSLTEPGIVIIGSMFLSCIYIYIKFILNTYKEFRTYLNNRGKK